ncbi:hypothetical protein L916_02169 [Phytophthora nicotianae]|uniref:Uncharacterized protein n=1 Tax=Phytophthora nicotianae TaxID=4792 RepID=W2JR12_PHYNI|nr:hypothetical protein L916_02169 [Phytophthora nicotianae]
MANELKRENIAAFLLDPGMVYTNMPLSSYESEAVKVVAEMANVIGKATMTDTGKLMDYNGPCGVQKSTTHTCFCLDDPTFNRVQIPPIVILLKYFC